ncbi:TIGR01777 family oxidoreductase [Alteromonas oceanisediminis]|uniref:TIGR01777 family oxidoreductase n=1 Tax=Alteromonas oceanisediminis TaxID=2836180 RepID=UPI001BD9E26A|nr:TIGR01777 family oxidoreductase [Alteromonas oceanisediminis]MBT0588047.1 TIGR01777 family oxidoreductase [Alteromonas oceanisediminis]
MKILITGGTGLIGRAFIHRYASTFQFTVLTRNPDKAKRLLPSRCQLISTLDDLTDLDTFEAVINLAGEPIADKRWTDAQKQRIEQSRYDVTRQLVDLIQASSLPPSVMISGSAIGYYGRQGSQPISEQFDDTHDEFSHRLCAEWERIAKQAASAQTRVCLLRTGVVLSDDGGALAKMMLPFKMGLGGPIASGKQYMSWIHITDMINAIYHLLNRDVSQGAYNLTAPYPETNRQFVKKLGSALHRPALIPMPEFALRILMGESADLLVYGQNVVPSALDKEGFAFLYPKLEDALAQIIDA